MHGHKNGSVLKTVLDGELVRQEVVRRSFAVMRWNVRSYLALARIRVSLPLEVLSTLN